MSSNTNELATAELVDRGLEALKARDYRQALTLWEEVHRRHPDHPRATRLVQELRAWLERRNTVKPRTNKHQSNYEGSGARDAGGDLHRVEQRIRDLEQRLESTVSRKSELLDEINDLHAHYREREEELQRTHEKRVLRLSEEISELRDSDGRLRQQHLETSQDLVRFERERDDAQLRANSLHDDLEKERRTTEDLRERLGDLREEQSDLRTQLAAFNQEEIDDLREIAETIEPLQQELRVAHQTIEELKEAQAALRANLADSAELSRAEESKSEEREAILLARLDEANEKYRIATRESEEAHEALGMAQKQLEAIEQIEDNVTRTLAETERSNQELRESLEGSLSKNAALTDEVATLQSRNAELIDQLKSVEERLAALVPLDDEIGERARKISDSLDISSLLDNEDEFRAELTAAESKEEVEERSEVDDWADENNQIFDGDHEAEDFVEHLELPADDLDTQPDAVSTHEGSLLSDEDDEVAELAGTPFEESDLFDDELSAEESHDENLSELLGSSMDTLFENDDDFVDLDAPSGQSYLSSNQEEFELVDPDQHPGYSGEFEALLMSTPDLPETDSGVHESTTADRFQSLTNRPDAVVSAIKNAAADETELSPMSAFVLSRIDQQVRIGELIDTMGLPASKTISCLEELEQRGFINVEA